MTILLLLSFTLIEGTCSAVFGNVDLANIPVAKAKTQFLELYQTQWKLSGLGDKLDKMIDEATDEHIAGLMWGTAGFRLGMNYDGIVDKIQKSAVSKFSALYEKFLAELEKPWGDILQKDILNFYEETNAGLLFELNDNPMVQAQLRQDCDSVILFLHFAE